MTEPGTRVVAIRDSKTDGTMHIYGFGTYVGMEVPPDEIGFGFPNPRIDLDSGETVWGCQCWWRPCEDEDELREKVPGVKVIIVVPVKE